MKAHDSGITLPEASSSKYLKDNSKCAGQISGKIIEDLKENEGNNNDIHETTAHFYKRFLYSLVQIKHDIKETHFNATCTYLIC